MNIAVILSAGSGRRFNSSSSPKQFLPLNQNAVIYYSLKTFEESGTINSILVVSHLEYLDKTKRVVAAFSKVADVIVGGERRQDSVWNALEWIKNNIVDCDRVFIHDAARPLFSKDLINNLNEAANIHKAVIPVLSVVDTIKELKGESVKATLDRTNLVRVQTPQVFHFKTLYKAYLKFPKDQTATDDAFIVENSGIKVYTVLGEKNNLKITHPVDLKIAEVLMNEVI